MLIAVALVMLHFFRSPPVFVMGGSNRYRENWAWRAMQELVRDASK